MKAYPDRKCSYGYMVLCDICTEIAPYWVDTTRPISSPPTLGTKQQCELCKKVEYLLSIESGTGKTFVIEEDSE